MNKIALALGSFKEIHFKEASDKRINPRSHHSSSSLSPSRKLSSFAPAKQTNFSSPQSATLKLGGKLGSNTFVEFKFGRPRGESIEELDKEGSSDESGSVSDSDSKPPSIKVSPSP